MCSGAKAIVSSYCIPINTTSNVYYGLQALPRVVAQLIVTVNSIIVKLSLALMVLWRGECGCIESGVEKYKIRQPVAGDEQEAHLRSAANGDSGPR